MDLVTDRSNRDATTVPQANGRPWGAPGPEAHWWHGDTGELPEVPVAPSRRSGARHRERAADRRAAATPTPPAPALPAPAPPGPAASATPLPAHLGAAQP